MSHEEDIKIIESFLGKECERSLACNSLKIRFGEKHPYIWIEPPWAFHSNEGTITTSYDYPENDDDFYEWSKKFNPINKVIFSSFSYEAEGDFKINFDNGYSIIVPHEIEDDEYPHWYASL